MGLLTNKNDDGWLVETASVVLMAKDLACTHEDEMRKAHFRPAAVDTTLVSDQMLHRIRSEFAEMPGLQLTTRQAERLWGLDADTCLQVLTSLVEAKFLRRIGTDRFGRLPEGR